MHTYVPGKSWSISALGFLGQRLRFRILVLVLSSKFQFPISAQASAPRNPPLVTETRRTRTKYMCIWVWVYVWGNSCWFQFRSGMSYLDGVVQIKESRIYFRGFRNLIKINKALQCVPGAEKRRRGNISLSPSEFTHGIWTEGRISQFPANLRERKWQPSFPYFLFQFQLSIRLSPNFQGCQLGILAYRGLGM